MPPSPPRSHGSPSQGHRPGVSFSGSQPPSSGGSGTGAALKILMAGVDKDARGSVEAAVRRAFERRPVSESWSVSLVRLAGKWSVTLSGPGERFRNLSFTADESRLAEAIGEAIGGEHGGPAPGPAASHAPPPATVRERHVCERCRQAILVVYESRPDDTKELAPIACPHCWTVNHVEIGAWAASASDYRAEKA